MKDIRMVGTGYLAWYGKRVILNSCLGENGDSGIGEDIGVRPSLWIYKDGNGSTFMGKQVLRIKGSCLEKGRSVVRQDHSSLHGDSNIGCMGKKAHRVTGMRRKMGENWGAG